MSAARSSAAQNAAISSVRRAMVSGCKGARGKEPGSSFSRVPCRVRVLELKVSSAVRAFGPERNVRLLAKRYRQRRMERGRDVRQASAIEPFSDF